MFLKAEAENPALNTRPTTSLDQAACFSGKASFCSVLY
jgi:hypothetical protein